MSKAIFWFRQDLRIKDNPALFYASQKHEEILCIYIVDKPLSELRARAQSWWLHHSLKNLNKNINLNIFVGDAQQILIQLCREQQIEAVYWNRCYEPNAIKRDSLIKQELKNFNINAQSFNASLLNEPWEVMNQQGSFFKVFTPYWKQCLKQTTVQAELIIKKRPQFIQCSVIKLEELKLLPTNPDWAKEFSHYWQPGEEGAEIKLKKFIENKVLHYKDGRNEPALEATSCLSPHLHFGEIGPAQIFRAISKYQLNHPEHEEQTRHFLSELGWREFSYYLLYHFPRLTTNNFKPQFDGFPWHEDKAAFDRWKKGQTGYPIVDAGMRELWITGTMHNRVRMIVASFLVKDLFIDWREGAKWFDETLLDADTASNYASWQWVAGCGADAAPYFRIFNPVLQGEKFDGLGHYVRKWVPELAPLANKWLHQPWNSPIKNFSYFPPIVNHDQARVKALSYYQALKGR